MTEKYNDTSNRCAADGSLAIDKRFYVKALESMIETDATIYLTKFGRALTNDSDIKNLYVELKDSIYKSDQKKLAGPELSSLIYDQTKDIQLRALALEARKALQNHLSSEALNLFIEEFKKEGMGKHFVHYDKRIYNQDFPINQGNGHTIDVDLKNDDTTHYVFVSNGANTIDISGNAQAEVIVVLGDPQHGTNDGTRDILIDRAYGNTHICSNGVAAEPVNVTVKVGALGNKSAVSFDEMNMPGNIANLTLFIDNPINPDGEHNTITIAQALRGANIQPSDKMLWRNPGEIVENITARTPIPEKMALEAYSITR